jgi:hypothetical protein
LGEREAAVVIDYVKSRRTLRIRVGDIGGETRLADLFSRLGIDGTELAPARRYLLFGSAGASLGGVRDLVAVFGSEQDARHAFVERRRQRGPRSGWAELCQIDLHGRVSIVCAFGRDRPLRWRAELHEAARASHEEKGKAMPDGTLIESRVPATALRPRPHRRLRRVAAGVIGLAAIGGIALSTADDGSTNRRSTPTTSVAPPRTGEALGACGRDITCDGLPPLLSPADHDVPGAPAD